MGDSYDKAALPFILPVLVPFDFDTAGCFEQVQERAEEARNFMRLELVYEVHQGYEEHAN